MLYVIINADDLGKTPEVNRAIANALTQGVITSSTIMANTQYWDEVHRIVDGHEEASFGVHLNLTEGVSLTHSTVLRQFSITDHSDCFTGKTRNIEAISDVLSKALYDELAAQVNKVKNEEGIAVSHIDGHHHIHTIKPLSSIVLQVAKDYGITRMRNRYTWPQRFPHFGLMKKIGDYLWRQQFTSEGIAFTKYFGPAQTILNMFQEDVSFQDGSFIEMMCHPGHPRFQEEYDLLASRKMEEYVDRIQFISYKDI